MDVESRLIVGERVSQAPNDKQELMANLQAIPPQVGSVAVVLIDSGFYSESAVRAAEQTSTGQPSGTLVYAALERKNHHRSVADLEQKEEPPGPAAGASVSEVMKHRLATLEGKKKYKLRQQTVEPVFGIIKSVLGFRRFLLRGVEKVKLEWTLVCAAYNLKRLHRVGARLKMAVAD